MFINVIVCKKQICFVDDESICSRKYVVYYAICSVCDNSQQNYVCSFILLLHDRAYQHYKNQDETVFQHNLQHHHSGLSFRYKILSSCSNLKDLLFQEAIFIKRIKPTLNRKKKIDVNHFIDRNAFRGTPSIF